MIFGGPSASYTGEKSVFMMDEWRCLDFLFFRFFLVIWQKDVFRFEVDVPPFYARF